jgi:hypothetical protein
VSVEARITTRTPNLQPQPATEVWRDQMRKFAPLLRFVSVNTIVACVTVGIALGISNVLINHVHWLGAYLIACPARTWNENTPLHPAPLSGTPTEVSH